MNVRITPLDTLFIRDGRAFGLNDAHAAESIFPPPPRVVFGAWRGAILTAGGFKLSTWNQENPLSERGKPWPPWFGDSGKAGGLRQEGPILCLGDSLLFPQPLDTIFDEQTNQLIPLDLRPLPKGEAGLLTSHYLYWPRRAPKIREPIWISGGKLAEYLEGRQPVNLGPEPEGGAVLPGGLPAAGHYRQSMLWGREDRTNVVIETATHAHQEGGLFSLGHIRSRTGLSLFCRWRGVSQEAKEAEKLLGDGKISLISLGGEKRAAAVSRVDKPVCPACPDLSGGSAGERHFFRLHFATPAYFEEGWSPKGQTGKSWVKLLSDGGELKVSILAAAVGKSLPLAGYNIAQNRQRAMRRLVPAGSTYYLESQEPLENIKKLHGVTVGDDDFMRAQGFGLAFLGLLPAEQVLANDQQQGVSHV